MKVDLTALTVTQLADAASLTRAAERTAGRTTTSVTAAATEDRATLSSKPNLPSLVAQALATPATRQDKVVALRQQVSDGTYPVDTDNIVSALITSGGR